jgi:hypothetical protein
MKIETGNRRIFVISEGLVTLLLISLLALFVPVHGVTVLTITGGAVGVLLSFYFNSDGKVKTARAATPISPAE